MIFKLFSTHFFRYMKVCLVGSIGALIQLISFNILRYSLPLIMAQLISIEFAIISNFLLNNRISFLDRKAEKDIFIKKFVLFNVFSLGSTITQIFLLQACVLLLGKSALVVNLSTITGIALGSLVNYTIYNQLIWVGCK